MAFPDPALEQQFQRLQIKGSPAALRFSLVAGTGLFALFGLLDMMIGGTSSGDLLIIRFLVGIPIMGTIAALSFFKIFWRWSLLYLFLYMMAASVSLLIMLPIAEGTAQIIYPIGLLIVFFYSAFLINVGIVQATLLNLLIYCGIWVAMAFNPPPFQVEIGYLFFLTMGLAVATIGGWHLEYEMRMRFMASVKAKKSLIDAQSANAAKSQFLALVSHELRTPLNAIIGFAEIMKDELFGEQPNQHYKDCAGDIHASGEHLLAVIGDILDISRSEIGKLDMHFIPCFMQELIESSVRWAQNNAANAGIELALEIDPQLVETQLEIDPRRMRQAILNLLTNGVKFTRRGGHITVTAKTLDGSHGDIAITVADNGIGIDAEHLKRVFEPFAQVENIMTRHNEGLGLGLPIVRTIIESHDGRIKIESVPGEGTAVTLILPASRVLPANAKPLLKTA